MTESVLKKANELNQKINKACGIIKELEETRKKCWGNYSEVRNRDFYIRIVDNNNCGEQITTEISSDAARRALDIDIQTLSKAKEELMKEFSELN